MYDQHLDFIVPSQSLFSLLPRLPPPSAAANGSASAPAAPPTADLRPTYAVLNDPKAGETEIEAEVGRIANGLFSVLATMGSYFPRRSAWLERLKLIFV